jgi:sulfur carrier protein
MIVKINGKAEEIQNAGNIAELLLRKGLSRERVVVEHNCRIIPKEQLQAAVLNDNDNVEIVSFVGGG